MDINCAPLVADLFLLRYESDFMLSLSVDTQSNVIEEYVGKPSETDPIKFNISSKTSRGKTAQKDTTTDIASDSLVNSNFPHRWSPASLALNYFYHFLYLYITRITINNNAPHLKNQNRRQKSRLGTACNEITGEGVRA